MLTTDGCCGNLVVGWRKPAGQDPFMRTVLRSAPPPPLPPPPPAPAAAPEPEPLQQPQPAPAASSSEDDAWTAFVTPAPHMPNFRYTSEGKARFTSNEWAAVESFVAWLGSVSSDDLSKKASEWRYEPSRGASDREAGIVNYLRGLYITPCLSYLLASSLDGDHTGPLPALSIDVGAFAIEVVADRGTVARVSLVHESGRREDVAPEAAGALRCPHVRMLEERNRRPLDPLRLTLRPLSGHRLAVHIELLVP